MPGRTLKWKKNNDRVWTACIDSGSSELDALVYIVHWSYSTTFGGSCDPFLQVYRHDLYACKMPVQLGTEGKLKHAKALAEQDAREMIRSA